MNQLRARVAELEAQVAGLLAQRAEATTQLWLVAQSLEPNDRIVGHLREVLEVLGESEEKYMSTMAALYRELEMDYLLNKKKTLRNVRESWRNHLQPVFGELPAAGVSADKVTEYIVQRQAEGAANATINRETSALARMFSLAIRSGKITRKPHVQHLVERNVRSGYLRDSHYDALARETAKVGNWLRTIFEIGFVYGWRRSELTTLKVKQVDFEERTISLDAGSTKNDDPRQVRMTDEIIDLLRECVAGKGGEECVFTRPARTGTIYRAAGSRFWWISYWHEGRQIHRSTRTESEEEARLVLRDALLAYPGGYVERPVRDFRKDWQRACLAAGCPGLLFHDLRRSAVRRMINCGVRETTAMRITGHRSRSVFDRYAISNQADLDEAVKKLERKPAEGVSKRRTERQVASGATIANGVAL